MFPTRRRCPFFRIRAPVGAGRTARKNHACQQKRASHMSSNKLWSDQLYDWSEYRRKVGSNFAPEASGSDTSVAVPQGIDAGLADRTVQAVRKGGMPLRPGTGTRSQGLFVRQYAKDTSSDGVRTAGESRRGGAAGGQLPQGQEDHRRGCTHQPRATSPQGEAELNAWTGEHSVRLHGRRHSDGKHDSGSSSSRVTRARSVEPEGLTSVVFPYPASPAAGKQRDHGRQR